MKEEMKMKEMQIKLKTFFFFIVFTFDERSNFNLYVYISNLTLYNIIQPILIIINRYVKIMSVYSCIDYST